jgi:hypothetical protein
MGETPLTQAPREDVLGRTDQARRSVGDHENRIDQAAGFQIAQKRPTQETGGCLGWIAVG